CFVDMTGKIAAGVMNEFLSIEGRTRFVDAGVTNIVPAGLLALETNSGRTHHNEFAYIPEFNIKFGFQVTQHMSVFTGYNAIYVSKVERPGDQIDPNVNPTLLPISNQYNPQFPFGPFRPARLNESSDFFAQGFQFGLSFRY